MSHKKIVWVAAGALLILIGAYLFFVDTAVAPSDDTVSNISAGIRATVTLGPICPVERIPPEERCKDRPYQASFKITKKASFPPFFKSVSSGNDGIFVVELPPGEYTVMPILKGVLPHASPQDVTVTPGHIIEITIMFDSGIR